MTREPELPFVDEHAIEIAAEPESVWTALLEVIASAVPHDRGRFVVRALGCADQRASGTFPSPGSTMPGFHVITSLPAQELQLQGSHRFSQYLLTFRLVAGRSGRVRLRAETRAVFPGIAGSAYRTLVIGSSGHAILVRRMLRSVRRRAETPTYAA